MALPGFAQLKRWAQALKRDVLVAWFAAGDPATPWAVRALALLVAAYALSPIDLIPDVVPVLGLLDDLILVPLGLWLVLRLLPAPVLERARRRAAEAVARPASRLGAVLVLAVWLLALVGLGYWWLRS